MKRHIWLFCCLLFGLGIFCRLWLLGAAAFSTDNMEFYKLALWNQDIIALWKTPPWLNQIPLNETLSLLLVKAGLPAIPFVVRLPFAVMGILALLFVWRFTWRLAGWPATGFVLLLAVFNPYQLYLSRTAYHYSGVLCWSAAQFIIFWSLKEKLESRKVPTVWLVGWWFILATIACHMHMSVWVTVGLQGVFLLWFGWRGLRANSSAQKRFFIQMFIGAGLLGLLLSRWMLRALQRLEHASSGGKPLVGGDAVKELTRLLPAYFAGETVWGIVLLLIFLMLALVPLCRRSAKQCFFRSLTLIFVLHLAALTGYILTFGGGVAKITYFSSIWPLFIFVAGIGAVLGIQMLTEGRRLLRLALLVLLSVGYLSLVLPATWAIVHLDGKPTAYYKINDWVDTHLPAGTPILVDRWLESWNELAVHNPGKLNYTFTVPDEPIEIYRRLNWRTTAEHFFTKYPSAALLEVTGDRYSKELGSWTFPQEYFARSVSITNHAAVLLRRMGVIYTGLNTIRIAPRIRYNTTEDLIEKSRRSGLDTLRLYGEGWGYAKPGWQRGHFEDYRILKNSAQILLYNLMDLSQTGNVEIIAAAVNREKVIFLDKNIHVFAPNKISVWSVPLTLQPNVNRLMLHSPNGEPLYVLDIRWKGNVP